MGYIKNIVDALGNPEFKNSPLGVLGDQLLHKPSIRPPLVAELLDVPLTTLHRWFRVGTGRVGQGSEHSDRVNEKIDILTDRFSNIDQSELIGLSQSEIMELINQE